MTGPNRPRRSELWFQHHLPKLLNLIPGEREVRWFEVFPENRTHPEWYRHDLAELFELLARGRIRAVIAERFPLIEAATAQARFESSSLTGKIVLMCNEGR